MRYPKRPTLFRPAIALRGLLSLFFVLGSVLPVVAQQETEVDSGKNSRYPLAIRRVQVGLPAGAYSGENDRDGGKMNIFKAGSWAPVWVWVDCRKEYENNAVLVVETTDSDENTTVATYPMPHLHAGESRTGYELGVTPYLKPGSYYSEIHVSIRDADRGTDLAAPVNKNIAASQQSLTNILSIGSSLGGFKLAEVKSNNPNDEGVDKLRNGWVQLTQCIEANQLPDNWLGYKSVDLAILTTGSDSTDLKFFTTLGKDKARISALREWVMRGGKLLVSVGSNPEVLDLIPEIRDILPAVIPRNSKHLVNNVRLRWIKGDLNETLNFGEDRDEKISLTKLEARPEKPLQVLMPWSDKPDAMSSPIIVEGSYGLGRVLVSSLDLERPPLSIWKERARFWEGLLSAAGVTLPSLQESQIVGRYNSEDSEAFSNRFQSALDYFEGIPVVSFGWVALFIFLYILLIGPIDYFILKKGFRRLEWTWITFPLIVISVSAIAYYAAYAIKGRDMKVNKIDLVEIDLNTKRVYGTTWFSIFSPRIQNYTIGVEPRSDSIGDTHWTTQPASESLPNTVVSWVGNNRYGRETLLRRSYNFVSTTSETDASRIRSAVGLQGVPIPVWSTKAFMAEWMVPLDEKRPLVEAEFRRTAGDAGVIIGKLKSNLPIAKLEDVHLIHEGKDYALGTLEEGVERTETLSVKANNPDAANWLKNDSGLETDLNRQVNPGMNRLGMENSVVFRVWPFLFHDLMFGTQTRSRNAGYRYLDQSWRVDRDHNNEVILFGRMKITEGPAEEWMNNPQSPTRLWLNGIPGLPNSKPREELRGSLRQETCVMVIIPVLPAKK